MARTKLLHAVLVLLASGCGSGTGGPGSGASGIAPSGAPDGGGGCAQLLPSGVMPNIFVLPQDAWVSERRFDLRCNEGTSDGLGNLVFAVQTFGDEGKDPLGDARVYVLDPSSGTAQPSDVTGARGIWHASVLGLEEGFLGVTMLLDFFGEFRLTWYGHTGNPGARHDSGPGPGAFLAVLPDGRAIVQNVFLTSPPTSALEAYGSDGGLRWSTPLDFPDMAIPELVLGVDVEGNTLLQLSQPDGGAPLVWVDASGAAGVPFGTAVPRFSAAFRRAEGGFFLQRRDPEPLFTAHWAGEISPGSQTIEPPRDWLPTQPPLDNTTNWFRVAPGRDGYVIDRRTSPPIGSSLEVRSAAGDDCGQVSIIPATGQIVGLGAFELGADGTLVVTGVSCGSGSGGSGAPDLNAGAPVCTCAWQYWPGLLH